MKGRPAQVLLQVVVNDDMQPPVRFDEQYWAAIGVALMQAQEEKSYQPDYAVYHLGQFVGEFARRATPNDPLFAYKVQALRFRDALESMRENVKTIPNKAAATYVTQVLERATGVLTNVYLKGEAEQNEADAFLDWLNTTTPPSGTLFAGLADSAVKRGSSEGVPAGEKPTSPPSKPTPPPSKPGKPAPPDKKPGKP